MSASLPTGVQHEISSGEWRAVVTEVGAALRVLQRGGRDVVAGFAPEDRVVGCRGQQLLPWPNRIRDGRYEFDGVTHQLALTEPHRHNAIHGLANWQPWRTVEHGESHLTQRIVVHPQLGWPGTVEATITHRLDADGLTVEVTATNTGPRDIPFGYAAHPYLTVGEDTVDDVSVLLPADTYLEVDERLLPVRLSAVDGRPEDLRDGAQLGQRVLDTAFTDLHRDDDGRWRIVLRRGEREAVMWAGPEFGWAQLFTGEKRRDIALAVEPMTCGPDAFNDGPTSEGRLVLAPGDVFTGTWGITGR
ncbi:aldose epimerase [Auraticoccus sp. F435]|uniref:Aldose epimerase n=1 Tax=Auraticoccus cholistanensis TaxID=2656650 RepID=A0A6A9URX7_9ACTN|nr:aldose 1-epimerase family protein [Auraticoccus cholistanensis]MVA75666.1 aldose epimerase [Auraticoccus cholistanensis]